MQNPIATGKSSAYRAVTEALHRAQGGSGRCVDNLRMLWDCGLAKLIRDDFYALIALEPTASGDLLDAGCGTGVETRNFARVAPKLGLHGVDISSLALAHAVVRGAEGNVRFYQSALEALPFDDSVFSHITSHEVIEHVENPAVVLAEFYRVLKPGGICVIATPNGASLWVEHLRQRLMRLFGRRGAPVGADHTRPPSFWRREFRRAGFTLERQIYDGAALEFLTYVAPASWMRPLSRALEPLRAVPFFNLSVCDRVKFRLSKPLAAPGAGATAASPMPVCPICHAGLALDETMAKCRSGHRFGRNRVGLIDFTSALSGDTPGAMPDNETLLPGRRWRRRLRRLTLAAGCAVYVGFLALLLPIGVALSSFHQPFRGPA